MEDDDINMLEEYSYSSVGEPFSLNVPNDSGAITFSLTPADGDGTTFGLTPATGDSSTFNLTPAVDNYPAISPVGFGISSEDDVQSFTLGPTLGVVQQVQPINMFPTQHRMVAAQPVDTYPGIVPDQQIQYHQPAQMQRQQTSSLQHASPLQSQQASTSSHLYQRPSNLQPSLQPVYSHELSNTINAMTFTPPIQPGTTSNFTPDFSSFLPLPPSPSNLPSHQTEPPRISLTEGASGGTSISLHSAYGLGNTISITRKQKISPPLIHSQPPPITPTTISSQTVTPPINIPVLMSANATSPRIISPPTHLQYSQVSPRARGPQISPGASREPASPISKHASKSPVSSRCISNSPRVPPSSPGKSPNHSFQNHPPVSSPPNRSFLNKQLPASSPKHSFLNQQPPVSSPNHPFLNQPPGSSPPNRPFVSHPPKSSSPSHSFPNHPPGSSPPSHSFVSQQPPPGDSPNPSFVTHQSPMSMSPAVQPSPVPISMSPPKLPAKAQVVPSESHPQAQIKPPPPKKLPPAPGPEETLDPKDIPGVVMKKGNVDIGVFVNHIIQFKHPAFADGEGFAERCLTCIIRKMKNSLPALSNLEKATRSSPGSPDPGCVLIPRMKDGRITIAKTGAGVGGNKKIYPHLALVQIFRAPEAQNYGMLASCGGCTSPFAARGMGDFPDTEKVCISPLHYTPVSQDSNKIRKPHKSPATTPKKNPNFRPVEVSSVSHAAYVNAVSGPNVGIGVKSVSGQAVFGQTEGISKAAQRISHVDNRNVAVVKGSVDVMEEDDDYEDFDDGGIDWEAKWEEEAIDPDTDEVQTFNEEDMLKEIEYLTLSKDANGKACIVKAERELLEKLKVLDDLKALIDGNVNLDALIPIKEARVYKKDPISGDSGSTQFGDKNPTFGTHGSHGPNIPRPDINTGSHSPIDLSHESSHIFQGPSGRVSQGSIGPSQKSLGFRDSGTGPTGPDSRQISPKFQNVPANPTSKAPEESKEESAILNLLDDIKGSFERQFDMNLDAFGNDTEEHSFEKEFNMSNTFNMADFSSSGQPSMLDSTSSEPPSDSLLEYRSSNMGSSDAMFGGGLLEEEGGLPCIINSWSVQDQPQQEVDRTFLTAGTVEERTFLTAGAITQEQFYNDMFDQENS